MRRIGRSQFLAWYVPIWFIQIALTVFDIMFAAYFMLLMIWPMFALTTKRYHDSGSVGWFGLFQLIPGVGGITIIFAGCGMTSLRVY